MSFKLGQDIIDKIRGKKDSKNIVSKNINKVPCHRKQLFIRENGDIFPCCAVWAKNDLIIANLKDSNFLDKIEKYNVNCQCYGTKLIKGSKEDNDWGNLSVEFSYRCQATCAMCCVDAPSCDKNDKYKYFDELENLINTIKPKELHVQGGEILIQQESMEWLKKIKAKYPNMIFSIVTNANNLKAFDDAVSIFDSFSVSFCGFQDETYKKIMGINLNQTKEFCEKLVQNNKNFSPKYLALPNNFHETGLFLKWAIDAKPQCITLDSAQIEAHIRFDGPYDYWNKIIERTKKDIIKQLEYNHKSGNNIGIYIAQPFAEFFGINEDCAKQYGFGNIVIF